MGLGKTYSADYLIDSNGNTGVSGQVLISTATGIDWADGTAITGGPFLPLSAGSSYPLTNSLYLENTSGSAGASPSLYFKNGSGNFWRYLHESGGNFSIKEGTATRLTFKAGGNVGIGTTAPGTINGVAFSSVGLHVNKGTLGRTITEGSSWGEYIMNHSGESANRRAKFIQSKAGDINIGSYDDNGTQRLHARLDNNGTFFLGNISTAYQTVFFDSTPGSVYGNGTLQISPLTSPGSGIAQFTTNFADRVGGGTTKHNVRVGGTVTATNFIGGSGAYLPLSAGSSYPLTGALHFGGTFNYIEKNSSADMVVVANRHITFSDVISGVVNERMRIKEGGNVGIGTTNPGAKLHVKEASGSTSQIRMSAESNEANYGYLTMLDNTVNTAKLTLGTTWGYNTPIDAMTIVNGTVGIGTNAPNAYYANANNLVVGTHTGSNGISILSATDQTGWLVFADSTAGGDNTRGAVAYNHDNNSMTLRVNNNPCLVITSVGDVEIKDALLSNQNNTDVDTGTEAIASVLIATYTAAFFDFVIKKGTNVRSGTVYACHDGTNVEFTETSTQDLGDTSDVTLNVVISTIYLQLQATTTSDDWSVKSLIRAI